MAVHRLNQGFDVILVSAVWMHLAPSDRPRAFESLYTLLNPVGLLIISFRSGPAGRRPTTFPVTGDEIPDLVRQFELDVVVRIQNDDLYNRTEISWETVVLKRQN